MWHRREGKGRKTASKERIFPAMGRTVVENGDEFLLRRSQKVFPRLRSFISLPFTLPDSCGIIKSEIQSFSRYI
jgi:hypothetical protein